ncbi:DNA-binding response regulator, OmpR family, contains REC and winged-helix (wHTH) domain [Amycolatopsis arida]|uniref:DNA-binding response regulator, OmpR family, contains REC and winged-helix (WHTH) domain n=1 Tax=Amycolatopsis arida TaxID=587909 RepID=A0A1I6AN13_9PSEU|nr:response regulator transcription factor [Amycolatopsis arida]TDX87421.1 DNA-binding response OmpR family regulator [Amycolatopsis arida]SFQ70050.1 DNA-binding response regulator, OmpR family, contains REC and winged-helix (wHTH) domain [Amycolatopsis arida]
MPRVLLVEDDDAVAEALTLGLGGLGHQIQLAGAGEQALDMLFGSGPAIDVVLLDVMLPGMDGFEVCRRIRARSMVPVLLLTARSDPIDVVVGLEGGADDYVIKPCEPRIIDARMKAVLRRVVTTPPTNEQALRIGTLTVDLAAMLVTRDDAELHLTATELRLLLEFAKHPGQVLSRQVLLKLVWDYGYVGDSRIVDATVARLRAKIEDDPANPSILRTVRGLGYRLVHP